MGHGDSNKIIAATLGITPDTTKKYVRNAIDKLRARSRTHAAITAAQAGIAGNPIATIAETGSASSPLSVAPQEFSARLITRIMTR